MKKDVNDEETAIISSSVNGSTRCRRGIDPKSGSGAHGQAQASDACIGSLGEERAVMRVARGLYVTETASRLGPVPHWSTR